MIATKTIEMPLKWEPKKGSLQPLCYTRPSRNLLWNLVGRDLYDAPKGKALDAACHGFTNLRLFHGHQYFGLDISIQRLQHALRKYPSNGPIAILADLTAHVPDARIFDIVVSTKTLSHLLPELRPRAVKNLIHLTQEGGRLFLDLETVADLDALLPLLNESFESIEIVYYGSNASVEFERSPSPKLSRDQAYTDILKRTYAIELNLPNERELHSSAYIRCLNRQTRGTNTEWNLRAINKKLYASCSQPVPSVHRASNEGQEMELILQLAQEHRTKNENVAIYFPNHALQNTFLDFCALQSSKLAEGVSCYTPDNPLVSTYQTVILTAMDRPATATDWEETHYFPELAHPERRQRIYALRTFPRKNVVFTHAKQRNGEARIPSRYLEDV